jgi:hypothetical protein
MHNAGTRITVVGIVAFVAALSLPGGVSATSPPPGKLTGAIQPSGHAKLRIRYAHKHHERVRYYSVHFYRVPLKCTSGAAVARYTVKGVEEIRNRYADRNPFGFSSSEGNPKHPFYKEKVSGHEGTPSGWRP